MHIMSGVMNPLQTLFGVMSRRAASSLTLMLPSFEAVYPRAYMRRPTSTMSARSEDSVLKRFAPDTWRGRRRNRRRDAPARQRAKLARVAIKFSRWSQGVNNLEVVSRFHSHYSTTPA